MLKRIVFRWLYPKLILQEKGGVNYPKTINRYIWLMRNLSLDNASLRTLKQYQIRARSTNSEEFITYLENLGSLIGALSESVDQHQLTYKDRQLIRFNLWLTDNNNYAVEYNDLIPPLLNGVSAIILQLEDVKINKNYMHHYYLNACIPAFKEIVEIMDLLVSIDLGVSDVKRNARSIIKG